MWKRIGLEALSLLKIAVVGGGVAYYVVQHMPIQPQVMVVRTTDIQKGLTNLSSPESNKILVERTAALKLQIARAVQNGIVVVDADGVLAAPSDAYIEAPNGTPVTAEAGEQK